MGEKHIEKPSPLTKERWGSQEHLDGLVSIESVRSAYLLALKRIFQEKRDGNKCL